MFRGISESLSGAAGSVCPPSESLLQLIGNTPLVQLRRVPRSDGANVFAKLEYTNPGGSVKDRIALGMLEDGEQRGMLAPGGTVIEPTAGNTGIGLALVGVSRGYRVILVVPDKFSREKMMLMQALGGELELTPGADGMQRAIDRAHELAERIPGAWVPQQFANRANPDIHYQTTGPELWAQLDGRIDAVVIGVGTGGTFSGVARYIKERNPGCLAVAVEPRGSILGGGEPGEHRVEGIGMGFIPETIDLELIDEVMTIDDEHAFATVVELGRREGLLAGSSAGAAVWAACRVAERLGTEARVATIVPDSGERYLSTGIYPDPRAGPDPDHDV